MKNKSLLLVLLIICVIIAITVTIYLASNIIPQKIKYNFNEKNSQKFIKNSEIQNKNGRVAIYLDATSEIFKEYDYHSYVSGDAKGKKIYLQMYIVSEDKECCYKIKSICYDYQNPNNLRFIGYYYNWFINKQKKYKLALYIPDTDVLYTTNIDV